MPEVYVKTGGVLYFIAVFALFLGLIILLLVSKKLGPKFAYRFVFWMYWANFALHFLKQFMPGYFMGGGLYLSRSSMENFCALFVVTAPFMLLSKKKLLYDYLFYMGIISSIGAYLAPTSPATTNLLSVEGAFEVTRYYLCHAPLLYGGILLVVHGYHKLDYKRFWAVPFLIFVAQGICWVNSVVVNAIFHNFEWSELLSRENGFMNSSFENGPPKSLDKMFGWLYPYLFNHLQYYYNEAGEFCFTPVLWDLPLFYLVSPIIFVTLCLPFEIKHIKADRLASPFRGRINR